MTPTYKILVASSAISTLWLAFEMFGLTLFGSQMLFFSITHTYSLISIVVLVSSVGFLLLSLVNGVCVLIEPLKLQSKIPARIYRSLFAYQSFIIALLLSYEFWTSAAPIRILVAVIGLAGTLLVCVSVGKYLVSPDK